MNETYTFSRALYLMRYGGKKMRPLSDTDDFWIIVKDNTLIGCSFDGVQKEIDEDNIGAWFGNDILKSWVEVK